MFDKVKLAKSLGLEFTGHDHSGYNFAFLGYEKRIPADYQSSISAIEKAADWALNNFSDDLMVISKAEYEVLKAREQLWRDSKK